MPTHLPARRPPPLTPAQRNAPFALMLLLCAAALQAFGAAPAVTVKTRTFEGTVTIDDALKTSPGLVNDCLAEGRSWLEKMRVDADNERRENPGGFADGQQWHFDRDYTQRSVVSGRYVSIVRTDYSNTGGAHPNTAIDTILWDREAQKRISIRPFFAETADNGPTMTALARLAQRAVAAEKIARGAARDGAAKAGRETADEVVQADQDIRDGIKPTLLKLGPVTLAPSTERGKSSGLTFHYAPYAVGAYAEGSYIVFVPWTAFRQFLSSEGVAIFAGARPPGDADKLQP